MTPGSAESASQARLNQYFKGVEIRVGSNDPVGYRLVVNGTPLGMSLTIPCRPTRPAPPSCADKRPVADVGDEKPTHVRRSARRGCARMPDPASARNALRAGSLISNSFGFGVVPADEGRP